MASGPSQYDTWYSETPSQAEGERDEAGERTAPQHRQVPRTQPSQAEGERGDDVRTADRGRLV
ncbi:hypothetical protein GCM10010145_50250 [Streptomyces ruber]|uniref:Uncharacterized protein n=2 Tax=Streptomyces TaxID=1883 RepID=A0A918BL68_9ACTN|nr:hypothetical protein [Streptomyces ruber]GGQ74499.1 hypothetical protein GCM10010145_50250 [Streptomyces ruber]